MRRNRTTLSSRTRISALLAGAMALSAGLLPHEKDSVAAPNPNQWQAPPPLDWPASAPIVESEEVGYLPGGGAVTPAGDYTYTLPISVPEGRAGMAPRVALQYSARGGNGLLGKGWTVDYGGSQIERCRKTFAVDGEARGQSFALDDALCLDGQRLIRVAGPSQMVEGAEYRTERDTLVKVVAHGDNPLGPDSFEVFDKSGTVRVYRPLEARRVTEPQVAADAETVPPVGPPETVRPVWVLREQRDRDGNVILYDYDVESEELAPYDFEYRIHSISYTGLMNDAGLLTEQPRREVRFEYSSVAQRPDQAFYYESGIRKRRSRRLERIDLYAPNPTDVKLAGRYMLTYDSVAENDGKDPRSLLASVQRLDASGRAMWQRQFDWDYPAPLDFDVNEVATFPSAGILGKPMLLDVDNDGKDEMIYAGRLYRTSPGSIKPLDSHVQGGDVFGRPADVDGDGKMEVLRIVNNQKVFVQWNDLTSTFDATDHIFPNKPVDFVDADGDGRIDAFQVGPRVNPNVDYYDEEWYFRRNTGAGLADPEPIPIVGMPYRHEARTPKALDLNGDGRGELHVDYTASEESPLPHKCPPVPNHDWHFFALEVQGGVPTRNTLHAERCPQQHVLADVNGDGLKDIIHVSSVASTVRFNTGVGFLPEAPFGLQIVTSSFEHDYQELDVDGDGREDLISSHELNAPGGSPLPDTYLYLPRNAGIQTFNLGQPPYLVPAYDPYPPGGEPPPGLQNHSPLILPADLDGDGLADFVVLERSVPDNQIRIRALVQKWHPRDVIRRVWDEGAAAPRESVFYSAFPTDAPSPSTCVYPSRCTRRGMLTAREHWIHRQDEPTAVRRTAYEFDDARLDLRGRGFLGFGKVRVTDLDSRAETTSYYDHATIDAKGRYPFAAAPRDVWQITPILQTSTDAAGGVVLPKNDLPVTARVRHTHNDYVVKELNGDRTYLVVPSASESSDWEQHVKLDETTLALLDDGSETSHRVRHATRTFDDFGNETASAAWTEGGQHCETISTFDNFASDWRIGLRRTVESACNEDGVPLPEKRLTATDYDALGHVVQVTVEPNHPDLARVTTFTRNVYGQVWKSLSSVAGEPVRTSYIAYDLEEHVYPRATCNALNHCERQLVHPALGVPVVAEDKNGVQAHFLHDGFGRVRAISPEDGISTETSYQSNAGAPWGIVTLQTSEDGGESSSLADDWGRTIRSDHRGFDGDWIHERVDYNLFSQATRKYRPTTGQATPAFTETTFDTLGRTVSVVEPNGATTSMTHSMFETVTTNPIGHKSRIARDVDDRLSESTNLYQGSWVGMTYVYGANSQVEDVIDSLNHVVHAEYDKLGRRYLLDDPDRGLTTWTYNGFGEITSEIDALGDTTYFDHDILGRVTWTSHDVNGDTLFWYDGQSNPGQRGRLTFSQSPDGVSVLYDYDSMGRNHATQYQIGGRVYTIHRSWDTLGRPDILQYPAIPNHDPFRVRYDYNPYGYASSVRDVTDMANPKFLWQVDARNADGLLTFSKSGNDVAEGRQYDGLTGQLTDVEAVKFGTALFAVHYDRDPTGNIVTRDDHGSGVQRLEGFQYDELDRLTTWSVRAAEQEESTGFGYDVIGNLETITTSAGTETHSHDGQVADGVLRFPHALTARSGAGQSASYHYDARGRQVFGGGREITWKPFDLPSAIYQDGHKTSFSYDAFGARVRKERFWGAQEVDGVDTIGGIYERRWAKGEPTRHVLTVNGADGPVAQVVYTESANDPGTTLYLHKEALGSVGLVTDNLGGEIERTYFDPFGAKVTATGQATSPDLGDVKLGFTGHRHDDELGLVDMRGRVYDPAQKRFLSADPTIPNVLFGQDYNRYSYVLNNPLRYTDPTGFSSAAADLKRETEPTNADVGVLPAASAPIVAELNAAEIVVTAKSDDTGHEEQKEGDRKSAWEFYSHMAWGAAKQLALSLPPVMVGRQIYHNYQVVGSAISHAADGDWDLAGNSILELPQQNAEAAGSMLTAPVEAAMAIPGTIDTALNATDPVERGAAAVEATQQIATVVMTVVAAGGGKGKGSPEPGDGSVRVRHFTNSKGIRGIKADGVIKASDQNRVFTVKAQGRPGSPRDVEQALGIKRGRGNHFVEFDAKPGEFETLKNARTGATETVFRGDVDLNGRNATFFNNR